MNAHGGGRGVTLSLHKKGAGGQRHVPAALPWESDPVHTAQEAGQATTPPSPDIKSRTVEPLVCCNTDYAIPATD